MRSRVVGSALGVSLLALASACATSTGSMAGGSHMDARPPVERSSRGFSRVEQDSIIAQALADREGPRVDVRAVLTNISSSRRMRAAFRVEDDAYVLIGHLDSDGNVRIVFPNDPRDDGFVKGNKSYETNEFFAGFADQYRYRYHYSNFRGFHPDAYDGGFGYVFIIASWRPMHFEKFAGENGWDSFEMTDAAYMNDPRPAIYELASLLAGENRESYTVKFARYYNTQSISPYSNALGYSALGYGMCSGFQSAGYGFSPFSLTYYNPAYTYGEDFFYRGSYYLYNGAGNCYYTTPAFAQPRFYTPGTPLTPPKSRPRVMAAEDSHRQPVEPKPPRGKVLIQPDNAGSDVGAHLAQHTSPQYRDRGLITTDDPAPSLPGRRTPRVETTQPSLPTQPSRPSIQQMVERRTTNGNDGSGWTRSRVQPDYGGDNTGGSRVNGDRPARVNGGNVNSSGDSQSQPHSRPVPQDNPRTAPQSAPRYEPPPRVETPRSEPVSRPAPPPPSTSSGSSSGDQGSKPVKPPV